MEKEKNWTLCDFSLRFNTYKNVYEGRVKFTNSEEGKPKEYQDDMFVLNLTQWDSDKILEIIKTQLTETANTLVKKLVTSQEPKNILDYIK